MKKVLLISFLFTLACHSVFPQTTWNGNVSDEWNNPLNWSNGVPVATTDVIIAQPLSGNFAVISAPAYCKNIIIEAGSFLGIGASSTLEVQGDMTNFSSFDGGNGTVIFAGNTHINGYFGFHHIFITGTLIASSNSMDIDGNWTNEGFFLHNNGTVNFFDNTTISGSSESQFYNVGIYGTLTSPDGEIGVEGNWINNGIFNHNNGTVRFNGTTNQSIGISSHTVFYNLIIDNPANGVCLVGNVSIEERVDLVNGYLSIYTYSFNILSPEPESMARNNGYIVSETTPGSGYSFVNWNIGSKKGKYVIPFGTADYYIPVEIEIVAPASGNGMIGVATYHTDEPNNPYPVSVTSMNDTTGNDFSEKVVNRFWITTANGYLISPTSAITFNAATFEIGTNDYLITQKWGGTNWLKASSVQQSFPEGARAENLSEYSIFALAAGPAPLPPATSGTEEFLAGNVIVFPNIIQSAATPVSASGFCTDFVNVLVMDVTGKTILNHQQNVSDGKAVINFDRNNVRAGTYILCITENEKQSIHRLTILE